MHNPRKTGIILCQVADGVAVPSNPVKEYYKRAYSRLPGYRDTIHPAYMELPTWMAYVYGDLFPTYNVSKHIVYDLENSIDVLSGVAENNVLMFSVLDTNKYVIRELVSNYDGFVVLGGYVNPNFFADLPNVTWLNSLSELSNEFLSANTNLPNYNLFRHERTIPRITMSRGCWHECDFCTIPRVVTPLSWANIARQALSFGPLEYTLMYVDDKTFGQAGNWEQIADLYRLIRNVNGGFRGFIVQTTVPYATKYYKEWFDYYFVRYIEVGVEIVDDQYLRSVKKPYNLKMLDKLMEKVVKYPEVGFIPNILLGLPGAQYDTTVSWLDQYKEYISFVNPFILSIYEDAKGEVTEAIQNDDRNELSLNKSWLNHTERGVLSDTLDYIFQTFGG